MAGADAPTVHIVQRMRVAVEAAGAATFAKDLTGTLGVFTDVPVMEGTGVWEPLQDTHNALAQLQTLHDYQEEILGKKHWTLSFSLAFAPTGTAVGNGVTAVEGPVGILLKTILGGVFLGTGSIAATGGWATAGGGDVASGDGTGFRSGGVAGHVSSGQLHLRPLESVTGDALALKVRFPSAPASGDVIYSGATYFFGRDPKTSLQFIVEGDQGEDRWVLMGGQGKVTPTLNLDGEVQALAFEITGVDWLRAEDCAGSSNLFETDLAQATYSNYEPLTGHEGECLVKTAGELALTNAVAHISSITFESGMAFVPIPSPSGVNGVLRHRVTRAAGTPPVSGSFANFYGGNSRQKDKEAKRTLLLFYRNGTVAGEAVAMEAPSIQVTHVKREDHDNVAGEVAEWKGRADTEAVIPSGSPTAGVVDMANSPWRFHLA